MTERESEELYEELRRKLEGYGSTPPPDMWAAIQRQLPPPAPTPPTPAPSARPLPRPALRRRWALALLALVGAVIVSVLAIRSTSRPEVAARPAGSMPQSRPNRPAAASPGAQPAPVAPPAAGASAVSQSAQTASRLADSSTSQISGDATDNAGMMPRRSGVATASPAAPALAPGRLGADTVPAASARRLTTTITRRPAAELADRTPATARRRRRKELAADAVLRPDTRQAKPASRRAIQPAEQGVASSASEARSTASPKLSGRINLPVMPADSGATAVAATPSRPVTQPAFAARTPQRQPSDSATAAQLPPAASSQRVPFGGAAVLGGRTIAMRPESGQPLAEASQLKLDASVGLLWPSVAQLPVMAPATPAVQAVAVAPQVPRPTSRWAVEVLAGPAISFRRLDPTDSARFNSLERPAFTFASQVQVRYVLGPRLSVRGGLGYLTYATRLNLLLQAPRDTAGTLPAAQPLQQRDTYRYFTLPLQAQYQLGGQTRLQYGVAAGVALELYAGGRTSGSTACTCSQQQSWSGTNSPYRQLGVSLTAGLEVRYALTPRLHLLVQPTGRYALVSIVAPGTVVPAPMPPSGGNPLPSTTLPARHPFAAGLLTGFSFDLR